MRETGKIIAWVGIGMMVGGIVGIPSIAVVVGFMVMGVGIAANIANDE